MRRKSLRRRKRIRKERKRKRVNRVRARGALNRKECTVEPGRLSIPNSWSPNSKKLVMRV